MKVTNTKHTAINGNHSKYRMTLTLLIYGTNRTHSQRQ